MAVPPESRDPTPKKRMRGLRLRRLAQTTRALAGSGLPPAPLRLELPSAAQTSVEQKRSHLAPELPLPEIKRRLRQPIPDTKLANAQSAQSPTIDPFPSRPFNRRINLPSTILYFSMKPPRLATAARRYFTGRTRRNVHAFGRIRERIRFLSVDAPIRRVRSTSRQFTAANQLYPMMNH